MTEYFTKEELEQIATNAIEKAIKKAKKDCDRIIAELTMPSVASWNGKWSGENDNYTILITDKKAKDLLGSYSYNFGDGWRACVTLRNAKRGEKPTNNFCGYDWMINSILKDGKIQT